jgi:hypothetical protein
VIVIDEVEIHWDINELRIVWFARECVQISGKLVVCNIERVVIWKWGSWVMKLMDLGLVKNCK